MKKKTIGLNMIVKNESHIIEETLTNACKYFNFSYWIICDTGSTDNTIDIIKNFFKKKNIKGEIHQHEWVDFGYNRTKALEAAYGKCDYIFIHDADDLITGILNIPLNLDKDGYYTNMANGPTKYKRLNFVNNRLKWKYVGVLHEYIQFNEDRKSNVGYINSPYQINSRRLGDRSKDPPKIKYKKDALILVKAFEDDKLTDITLKNRYAFYAGNSWMDSSNWDEAIEWYSKRIELGGWYQEIYISHLRLGYIYKEKKKDIDKSIYHFVQSTVVDPSRLEGLYSLFLISQKNNNEDIHIPINIYLTNQKNINFSTNSNKLFFNKNIYETDFYFVLLKASILLSLKILFLDTFIDVLLKCKMNTKNRRFNKLLLDVLGLINNIQIKNHIKKSSSFPKVKRLLNYFYKHTNNPNINSKIGQLLRNL